MQLNYSQRLLLLEKLEGSGYWKNPPCSICQSQSWNLADIVFELREFNQGNMVVGAPVMPVIAITCNKCGNTLLLNAIVLELLPKDAEEKQQ